MKKVLIYCTLILFLFITGCSSKLEGYTKITYEDFKKKIENKETFPLVIGSSECSACANYEIVMTSFIKDYQIEVFMIDLLGLDEEEYNELKTSVSFTGTPTTVFYKDGKLTSYYNRIDGSVTKNAVKDYFKNNGYIE